MHLSQIELTQQKCFVLMKHTLGNVMMQSQTDHCLNDLVLCITLFCGKTKLTILRDTIMVLKVQEEKDLAGVYMK